MAEQLAFSLSGLVKTRLSSRPQQRPQQRGEARECEWFNAPSDLSPETALRMAVLQRAVLDIITPGTPPSHRQSAIDWVSGGFGEAHERDWEMSFTRIVENITDMDVDEFRCKIFRFAEEALSSQSRADTFRFQRG